MDHRYSDRRPHQQQRTDDRQSGDGSEHRHRRDRECGQKSVDCREQSNQSEVEQEASQAHEDADDPPDRPPFELGHEGRRPGPAVRQCAGPLAALPEQPLDEAAVAGLFREQDRTVELVDDIHHDSPTDEA